MFVFNKKYFQTASLLLTIILNISHAQTNFQVKERQQSVSTVVPTYSPSYPNNGPNLEQIRLNNIRLGPGGQLNPGQFNPGQAQPSMDFGQKQVPQQQGYQPGYPQAPVNRNPNSFVLPPRSGFGFVQNYPNNNELGFQHQPFGGGFYPTMGLNPYFG